MMKTIFIGISALGTLMYVLGQIMSFVPGAETTWFLTTAALLAFGVFSRVRIWRITVVVLAILALGAAFMGHQRGIEDTEWISRQGCRTSVDEKTWLVLVARPDVFQVRTSRVGTVNYSLSLSVSKCIAPSGSQFATRSSDTASLDWVLSDDPGMVLCHLKTNACYTFLAGAWPKGETTVGVMMGYASLSCARLYFIEEDGSTIWRKQEP